MPEFDTINGLLRRGNNRRHLGPTTCQQHPMCKYTLLVLINHCIITNITWWSAQSWCDAASEVLPCVSLQHPALSTYTLCKCIVSRSGDNIKAWKPMGTGAVASYQERDGGGSGREQIRQKERGERLLFFVSAFLLWVQGAMEARASKQIILRKTFWAISFQFLHFYLWSDT